MPPCKSVYPKTSNCGVCDLKQYGSVCLLLWMYRMGYWGLAPSSYWCTHSLSQRDSGPLGHGPDPGIPREMAVPMGGRAVLVGRLRAALGAQAALWLQPPLCDSSVSLHHRGKREGAEPTQWQQGSVSLKGTSADCLYCWCVTAVRKGQEDKEEAFYF